jgi:peptidyl-prolyl cis-trans isomerase B (cyclophilin B)
MNRGLAVLVVVLAVAVVACSADPSPTPSGPCPTSAPTEVAAQVILEDAAQATISVSGAVSGEFAVELHGDAAPIATANFVTLARCGFYDGIKFHRVLADFVIQAGDPGTKSHEGDFEGLGQGGPGYRFAIEPPADGLDYGKYSVSMANAAPTVPDSNGSQFFVAVSDLSGQLPRDYTIFGDVASGTDVIDAIAAVPVNDPSVGVPLTPITIDSVVISAASEPSPSS